MTIIGIVEVNDRRYMCGVWADEAALRAEMEPLADITAHTKSVRGGEEDEYWTPVMCFHCTRMWVLDFKDGALNDMAATWYGEPDSFNAYEVDPNNAPGLIGFDED